LLNNNLIFLSEKLKNEISKIKPNPEISFKMSKDNNLVPILNNISLHSTYYPLKEYDKIKFDDNKNSICIALGFGAGYHLINHAKNHKILVICLDLSLLKSVLEKIDFNNIFDYRNIKIISHEEIFQYYDFFLFSNYFIISHPVLQNIYNNKIISILNFLKTDLNPILLDFNTQRKFGKIWQKNFFKNLLHFYKNDFFYEPLIINKPIMIVGAGPSLDKNITEIKKYRNNFYISSSDTSLKILLRNNIIPDSVFTIDPQNISYEHFFYIKNNNIRIFSDFLSGIYFKNCKQTPLFSFHPIMNLLKQINPNNIEIDTKSRNVGGIMIDFFYKYFKGIPIITVGIDFGYSEFKSYSKGSYISDFELNNSNYFYSMNHIDMKIMYKYQLINNNNWKSNSLLSEYSKSILNNNIYSLSDSPFTNFNKIDFDYILNNFNFFNNKCLEFNYQNINKDRLNNILTYKNDHNFLEFIPYFLSLNKNPDIKIINEYLDKIKKIFFNEQN
jgi:hypothetical protein